ncbi:hypothetical protein [Vreelandella populi]|uniref:hypothetical protein n=1 Tax=Vreelandella populi TaxID=2498858 RepID=UPI000F8CC023|nr:hypothetical protein [Halomonas populi]RUR52696.1 hypothetical protein ELY40_11640 [Halomonas populi]
MTYTEIQQALERRMASWPMRDQVPVWFDGNIIPEGVSKARNSNPRGPWVRFVVITSKAFTAGVGESPCRRVPGVITAEIYCPRVDVDKPLGVVGNPTLETLRIADSLAEHFQYWQTAKLSTLATSVVNVDPEDDWFRRNVVTDFDAD